MRTLATLLSMSLLLAGAPDATAQAVRQTKVPWDDKFRQLDEIWPTANTYRTASGAPGHDYWQQRADYVIKIALDEKDRELTGSAAITYTNNSPDTLRYVWLNMDQNRFSEDSKYVAQRNSDGDAKESYGTLRAGYGHRDGKYGFKVKSIVDGSGNDLSYTIVDTLMRIDLPVSLPSSGQTTFTVSWSHKIVESEVYFSRGGYEHFEDDGNDIFQISQWYPRPAVYSDDGGWHQQSFMGRSEFTLQFGDFDVEITVPDDHIVASTGVLQNPDTILTDEQRARLKQAETAKAPVMIVNQQEALRNEKSKSRRSKTWHFKAENVRDFAWASSRKFQWDAQGYQTRDDRLVMAMSYYPKEASPLWDLYSTAAQIHSMDVFGDKVFPYPYPVMSSVNGQVGGMEYPMLAFNGPRPVKDKKTDEITYSRATKNALIAVVIHEAGHNWFPMIVNSDERHWTWMDEGLNTYLQFLAEQLWEDEFPSRRGEPRDIVNFMKSQNQVPIMTDGESLKNTGANAYAKPATALNILRETILGRDLFDFAFAEYARRWKFKHPTPFDFFRTMEDASGVDLDWFWHGWFYTTDHVDISIENVIHYQIDTKDPDVEMPWKRERYEGEPLSLTRERNEDIDKKVDDNPRLLDLYNQKDRFTVTNADRNKYNSSVKKLKEWESELLENEDHFTMVDFKNNGGLVMPVILELTYDNGKSEIVRIPAEVWRHNPKKFSKLLITDRKVASITLDPRWETADTDLSNNYWPSRGAESRLELFKRERRRGRNLMKDMSVELKTGDEDNGEGGRPGGAE
ncbi:MAG: M1 family metallopeptidase [Rhodospirillaceae bacterium]|nr:M1 family metallopeptidase [Rhodospirillaceae bacterium]